MIIDNELLNKYNEWKCDCGGFPKCICDPDKKSPILTYSEVIKFAKDMCELQKIECAKSALANIMASDITGKLKSTNYASKLSIINCKNIIENEK